MARQFTAGVGVKLVAGFLVMAAVAAIIGYMGLASVSRVNGLAGSMYANEVSGMRHASQAQVHLVSAGRSARNALLAADKGARIGELYFMRDHIASAQSELEDLATLMRLPAQQEQVTQARQAVRA
jgi:methyl-accepting chemotaxis protein